MLRYCWRCQNRPVFSYPKSHPHIQDAAFAKQPHVGTNIVAAAQLSAVTQLCSALTELGYREPAAPQLCCCARFPVLVPRHKLPLPLLHHRAYTISNIYKESYPSSKASLRCRESSSALWLLWRADHARSPRGSVPRIKASDDFG
jgi:hypothetical protein